VLEKEEFCFDLVVTVNPIRHAGLHGDEIHVIGEGPITNAFRGLLRIELCIVEARQLTHDVVKVDSSVEGMLSFEPRKKLRG
jgi:hypothetical protein